MTTNIGIRITLKTSFEQAIQKATDALKAESFDMKSALQSEQVMP